MNYILLLQTLTGAIKAVEALMPASAGKDKFDAAITLVESVLGPVTSIAPQLEAIATLVVNGLHAVGAFTKSTPPAQ